MDRFNKIIAPMSMYNLNSDMNKVGGAIGGLAKPVARTAGRIGGAIGQGFNNIKKTVASKMPRLPSANNVGRSVGGPLLNSYADQYKNINNY